MIRKAALLLLLLLLLLALLAAASAPGEAVAARVGASIGRRLAADVIGIFRR